MKEVIAQGGARGFHRKTVFFLVCAERNKVVKPRSLIRWKFTEIVFMI